MSVTLLGNLTPVYFFGDSHCIGFDNVAFTPDWAANAFLCRSLFLRELPLSDYATPDQRGINPKLLAAFQSMGLVDKNGHPEYQSRAPNIAFLSRMPVMAPPIVLCGGENEIRALLLQFGADSDFQLPGDTRYGLDRSKQPIPVSILREQLREALRPFLSVARLMVAAGFRRLMIHTLPPRCADDARAARWVEGQTIAGSVRAKTALLANQLIAEFCAAHDIGCIDTWDEMTGETGFLRPEFELDGMHVNRSGHTVTLAKVAAWLFDHTRGTHNEIRYAQAVMVAPARAKEAPAQFAADGFAALACSITDLESAAKPARFVAGSNPCARPDWIGAPRGGRVGVALAGPVDALTNAAAALLQSAGIQSFLHTASEVGLSASSCRLVRVDPAAEGVIAGGDTGAPQNARRALLPLGDGLSVITKDASIPVPRGALLLFDPARVNGRYDCGGRPQDVLEIGLIPRLPNHPFRVVWAGLNDWPADPFCYSTDGLQAVPPLPPGMVQERP